MELPGELKSSRQVGKRSPGLLVLISIKWMINSNCLGTALIELDASIMVEPRAKIKTKPKKFKKITIRGKQITVKTSDNSNNKD